MNSCNCDLSGCPLNPCNHLFVDDDCPHCGLKMIEVKTTGFRFCSNPDYKYSCDYEDKSHLRNRKGDRNIANGNIIDSIDTNKYIVAEKGRMYSQSPETTIVVILDTQTKKYINLTDDQTKKIEGILNKKPNLVTPF